MKILKSQDQELLEEDYENETIANDEHIIE